MIAICTTKLRWNETKAKLQTVHPTLADAISRIIRNSGSKEVRQATAFVAEYDFGQDIISTPQFLPPCPDGGAHCTSCRELAAAGAYSPIPLGIVLTNSVEVYALDADTDTWVRRTVPLRLLTAGQLFGVFELLDLWSTDKRPNPPSWSVMAGARSLVILANLGNSRLPNYVAEEFGVKEKINTWGKLLDDHGSLIRYLYNKSETREPKDHWTTQILFLPREWLLGSDAAFDRVRRIIYDVGWVQSRPLRTYEADDAEFRRSWYTAKSDVKTKFSSNDVDLYAYLSIKHLASARRGDSPVMVSSRTVDAAGPFAWFEHHLKKAVTLATAGVEPVVLQPGQLQVGQHGLYSLKQPMSLLRPVSTSWLELLTPLSEVLRSLWSQKGYSGGLETSNVSFYADRVQGGEAPLFHIADFPKQVLFRSDAPADYDLPRSPKFLAACAVVQRQ